MHYVKKVAVFGSYLTDKDKLGDVDIAVLLQRREEDMSDDIQDDSLECISIHDKNVSDFFQVIHFPEKIVFQTLRNKSRSPRSIITMSWKGW